MQLRDAITSSLTRTFGDRAHDLPVALAFSPSGQRLATATARTAVSLWEIPTGRGVLSITRHVSVAGVIASGPDGQAIITGDVAGTVKLWSAVPSATQ